MHTATRGLREFGVDIELCYLGDLRSFGGLVKARSLIKSKYHKFDLVHAQFGSACAFATTVVSEIPKVLSLRGSDWHRYSERYNYEYFHGILTNAATEYSIKKFDAIVPVSNRMAGEIRAKHPNSRLYVIPSPIELDQFKPIAKNEAREKLGYIDDKEFWVLFTTLSSKNPVKRVYLAIETVKKVNDRIGNVRLRIATGIPHMQMPLFISSCDIAIITSTHEGWPNCIKEALACNIPFVATDVSDLASIAKLAPSCRVCPADPDILADNICDVLKTENSENLRQFVVDMDLPNTSEKLFSVYKELLL